MVERGGLEYPIRVPDEFSANTEKFRREIEKVNDSVEKFRRRLSTIQNTSRVFKEASDNLREFSRSADSASRSSQKNAQQTREAADGAQRTARAKKEEATATRQVSSEQRKQLPLGRQILEQAREETRLNRDRGAALSGAARSARSAADQLERAGRAARSVDPRNIERLRDSTSRAARDISRLRAESDALQRAQTTGAQATEIFRESLRRFNRALSERAVAEDVARRKIQAGLQITEREARVLSASEQANQSLLQVKRRLEVEKQKEIGFRRRNLIAVEAELRALRQLREEQIREATAAALNRARPAGFDQVSLRAQAVQNLQGQLQGLELNRVQQQILATDRRFAALRDTTGTLNERMNRISFTFRRLIGIMAAFTIARQVVQLFREMIRASLNFNRRLEQSRLGIGALIAAASEIRNPFGQLVEGAEALEVAIRAADVQIQRLRTDAFNTIATFEELVNAFQLAVGPGLAAGFNLDEIREFSVRVSQAAAAIGLPQRQLAEEIRALLTATARPGITRLADVLQIDNDSLRAAREAGTLVQFLREQFAPFATAGEQALQTFDAALARARDGLEQLFGTANQGFFNEVKGLLDDIRNASTSDSGGVVVADPEAVNNLGRLNNGLRAAVQEIRRLGSALDDTQIATLFEVAGRAIAGVSQVLGALIEGFLQGFSEATALVFNLVDAVAELFGLSDGIGDGFLSLLTTFARIATFLATIIALQRLWVRSALIVQTIYRAILGAQGLSGIFRFLRLITRALLQIRIVASVTGAQFGIMFTNTRNLARVLRVARTALAGFGRLLIGGGIVAGIQLFGRFVFQVDLLGKLFQFLGDAVDRVFNFLGGGLTNSFADASDDIENAAEEAARLEGAIIRARTSAKDFSEIFKDLREDAREAAVELEVVERTLGSSSAVAQQLRTAIEAEAELSNELRGNRESLTKLKREELAVQKELEESLEGIGNLEEDLQRRVRERLDNLQRENDLRRQIEETTKRVADLTQQQASQEAIDAARQTLVQQRVALGEVLSEQRNREQRRAVARGGRGESRRELREQRQIEQISRDIVNQRNQLLGISSQQADTTGKIAEAEAQLNEILSRRLQALGLGQIQQLRERNEVLRGEVASQRQLNQLRRDGAGSDTLLREEAEAEIRALETKAAIQRRSIDLDLQRLQTLRQQVQGTDAEKRVAEQIEEITRRRELLESQLASNSSRIRLDAEERITAQKERQLAAEQRLANQDARRAIRAAREVEDVISLTRAIEARALAEERVSDARDAQIARAASGIDTSFLVNRAQAEAQQQLLQTQLDGVRTQARIRADELRTLQRIAQEEGRVVEAQRLRTLLNVESLFSTRQEEDLKRRIAQVEEQRVQQETLEATRRAGDLERQTAELRAQLGIRQQLIQSQLSRDPGERDRGQAAAEVAQQRLRLQLAEQSLAIRLRENLERQQGVQDARLLAALQREYNDLTMAGREELQGIVLELRRAQEEQQRLQAIVSDPIGEGIRASLDELVLTPERIFNLVQEQTTALISGIGDTLANVVVAAFDPSQNVDAAEAFGRLLQQVAQQILSQVFQDLIAQLLVSLLPERAADTATDVTEVAAATQAATIRATSAASLGTTVTTSAATAAASLSTAGTAVAASLTTSGTAVGGALTTAATTAAGALAGVSGALSTAAGSLSITAAILGPSATILQTASATLLTAATTLQGAATTLLIANSIGAAGGGGVPGAASGGLINAKGGVSAPSHFDSKAVGYALGGSVRKAISSMRPRGLDPRDKVPIWARVGEHMMPPERVQDYGLDFFEALRHRAIDPSVIRNLMGNRKMTGSRSRIVRMARHPLGFAEGGLVPNVTGSSRDNSVDSDARDRLFVQPTLLANEDTMETLVQGGENTLRRFMRENQDVLEISRE